MASIGESSGVGGAAGSPRSRAAEVIQQHISVTPRLPDPIRHPILPESVGFDHAEWGFALARFANDVFTAGVSPIGYDIDREEFWRHAIAVAAVADTLDDDLGRVLNRRDLFAAAILHDVGKLVLGHCMPKAYARIRDACERKWEALHRAEHVALGVDHAWAGRMLAAHWELPLSLLEAIGAHHAPPELLDAAVDHTDLAAIMQLSDLLTHGERQGEESRRIRDTLCKRFGLGSTSAATVLDRSGECAMVISASLHSLFSQEGASGAVSAVSGCVLEADSGRVIAQWVEAITDFAATSSPHEGVAELCGRVVRFAAGILEVDSAVAFAIADGDGAVPCAAFENGYVSTASVFMPSGERVAGGGAEQTLAAVGAGPIVLPSPVAIPICERFRHVFSTPRQAMLPCYHGGRFVGGVLFDVPAERLGTLRSQSTVLGALGAALGCVMDWSGRVAAAERRTQTVLDANRSLGDARDRLKRSELLSTTSEMAAGAAHEINTPLAVISGRAQLLARQTKSEAAMRSLDAIREQSHIISELLSRLVAFAKPPSPQPEFIMLAEWLLRLEEEWTARLGGMRGILDVRVADAEVRIWADRGQLSEVFDALIENAVDVMPEENARLVINSRACASDDFVVVAVEDNGPGMSAEVVEKACDPFFSHRSAGRGRGLGLSMARRLVEINGGRLWLESAPGCGTTVYVELPSTGCGDDRGISLT